MWELEDYKWHLNPWHEGGHPGRLCPMTEKRTQDQDPGNLGILGGWWKKRYLPKKRNWGLRSIWGHKNAWSQRPKQGGRVWQRRKRSIHGKEELTWEEKRPLGLAAWKSVVTLHWRGGWQVESAEEAGSGDNVHRQISCEVWLRGSRELGVYGQGVWCFSYQVIWDVGLKK